jgi:hypothetical protein
VICQFGPLSRAIATVLARDDFLLVGIVSGIGSNARGLAALSLHILGAAVPGRWIKRSVMSTIQRRRGRETGLVFGLHDQRHLGWRGPRILDGMETNVSLTSVVRRIFSGFGARLTHVIAKTYASFNDRGPAIRTFSPPIPSDASCTQRESYGYWSEFMVGTDERQPNRREQARVMARRAASAYKDCALVVFNSLVLYLLLNVFVGILLWIHGARADKPDTLRGANPTVKYAPELLDRAYPDWSRQERTAMLAENWNRPFVYADYTHFQERPIAGKYVNVSEDGYRSTKNQGPWPPAAENLNVFVFGGSTAFGYGLPDEETIPSYLQEILADRARRRVCVYNFAVGSYYSTQERIRLERLVLHGRVPEIAIFIDGLNDALSTRDKPAFSRATAAVFEEYQVFNNESPSQEALARRAVQVCFTYLPVGRAARAVGRRLQPPRPRPVGARPDFGSDIYLANKYLIEQFCRHYNITPVFVWQPVPGYKYELSRHLFTDVELVDRQAAYYAEVRSKLDERAPEADFVWCADLQQGRTEPLYVDNVHYTAAFSKVFAESIVRACLDRKLLDKQLGETRESGPRAGG